MHRSYNEEVIMSSKWALSSKETQQSKETQLQFDCTACNELWTPSHLIADLKNSKLCRRLCPIFCGWIDFMESPDVARYPWNMSSRGHSHISTTIMCLKNLMHERWSRRHVTLVERTCPRRWHDRTSCHSICVYSYACVGVDSPRDRSFDFWLEGC